MGTTKTKRSVGSHKDFAMKKYLGDPEDPHFIPSSPIITRQVLTAGQEEELAHSCALVLSGVVTSDDHDDDPLDGIASQYVIKQTKYCENDRSSFSKPSASALNESSAKPRKYRRIDEDTATPSEHSERTTIDRTTTSTPLTMVSDNFRRRSSTRQSTGVRSSEKQHQTQALQSNVVQDPAIVKFRHVELPAAARSMTTLPVSKYKREPISKPVPVATLGPISVSHLEFNKSLPSLPRIDSAESTEKESDLFSRVFKMMKAKKGNGIETARSNSASANQVQLVSTAPPSKRNKFNIPHIFDRRRRHQPQQLVVA